MSFVDWLTPEIAGVEVPPGDPGALRAAARTFSAAGSEASGQARGLETTARAVTDNSWLGIAALAFKGVTGSVAADARAASAAFSEAASALQSFASELEAAQQLARRAQAAAADVNQRSARLDAAYETAKTQEAQAHAAGKPLGVSDIPGLLVQAGALQLEAFGVRSQAGRAADQAEAARAKAAAAFRKVATMAPSVQRALAEARAREARREKEPGGLKGFFHDVGDLLSGAGDKAGDFFVGAWHGVRDPVLGIVDLVNPFDSDGGFFGDWARLGSGLWHGVTHPVELFKAVVGVDVWREEGFAYWAGNLLPGAVAAFATGGAAAGARGAQGASRVARAADAVDEVADAGRAGRVIESAEDISRSARLVDDPGELRRHERSAEEADALRDAGRIDYDHEFSDALDQFADGHAWHHKGPLDRDLTLVQYFDPDRPGTLRWWTTTDEANVMPTIDDVRQRLALPPEWGERTAVRVARIPEGTDVEFLYGRAKGQVSEAGDVYAGGGKQFRFRDFDERWILETRRIP